jgi:hypothetical protein
MPEIISFYNAFDDQNNNIDLDIINKICPPTEVIEKEKIRTFVPVEWSKPLDKLNWNPLVSNKYFESLKNASQNMLNLVSSITSGLEFELLYPASGMDLSPLISFNYNKATYIDPNYEISSLNNLFDKLKLDKPKPDFLKADATSIMPELIQNMKSPGILINPFLYYNYNNEEVKAFLERKPEIALIANVLDNENLDKVKKLIKNEYIAVKKCIKYHIGNEHIYEKIDELGIIDFQSVIQGDTVFVRKDFLKNKK